MAVRSYPTGIKVYIDDEDVTRSIFGEDVITLTDFNNTWRQIDITPYVKYVGLHKLRITCEGGVGRVDAKITAK